MVYKEQKESAKWYYIAGCDTFRAGAIEQLLTHVRHLNNIFNEKNMPMIELYQRGYGKDAAGIAAEAINYGRKKNFDWVSVRLSTSLY